MSLDAALGRSGNLRGTWELKMFKNGRMFSHTTSSKGSRISNFKADVDGAILLETGEGAVLQLYYFTNLGYFAGNIYLKEGIAEFSRAGLVTLRKQ